jgi:hypothetical protein
MNESAYARYNVGMSTLIPDPRPEAVLIRLLREAPAWLSLNGTAWKIGFGLLASMNG